jgi:nitroreductase/NAD-dependent dihydropyrimidine dehydrogenase PreA subunit
MAVRHSIYDVGGTVTVNQETCIRCGECTRICPSEVLAMVEEQVRVVPSPFDCSACGHCMMVCPTGSVQVRGRGLSPEDLRPLPPPEARADADALEALMRSRRSMRRFTPEEVSPELLRRIVEMAATAPMGIPPWDVGCVIVRGRDRVQALAEQIVKSYAGMRKIFKPWVVSIMRPFIGKPAAEMFRTLVLPLAEKYVEARAQGKDLLFYDAPAVLLFHHSPYAEAVDAAIACTYAMLAAEALGLGSTIIGGAPPVLQKNKALCRELGIPEGHKPAFALIVGHPANRFRHTIRRRFNPPCSPSLEG